jgi:hypothetical protein
VSPPVGRRSSQLICNSRTDLWMFGAIATDSNTHIAVSTCISIKDVQGVDMSVGQGYAVHRLVSTVRPCSLSTEHRLKVLGTTHAVSITSRLYRPAMIRVSIMSKNCIVRRLADRTRVEGH